jgi:hypothetical protein
MVGTGEKKAELSTGRDWTAGLHHVTARSRLARVLKPMDRLFLNFTNFSGRVKPRKSETTDTESVDTGERLYLCLIYVCAVFKTSS